MALGQTLRYYRGQFSPERAYQDGSRGPETLSMYNPESQARFIDAVAKRQERFDAAKMAQSQEMARIGELETYDLAELNKRLKSFESGINELVKTKYNGDYSAAANEIAKQIGTERTNPFYHFNKEKVNMGRSYLDAKMKLGVNFMSSGNPFGVSFEDWQQGKTFEFTPINSADITQRSAAVFQNYAKSLVNDPKLRSVAGGQYFEYISQNGFRNEAEAMDFIRNNPIGQQMAKEVYDSMPELAGVENQDTVWSAINQGVFAGIGSADSRLVADQSYMNAGEIARMKGTTGGGGGGQGKVVTIGYMEGPVSSVTKKSTAIPIHALNPMYGTTSAEGTEIDRNIKGVDTYLSKILQKGDIVGVTPKDSKLLKDVETKELISFALVPTTTDTGDPYEIILNIMGTPAKTKDNRAPVAIPISTRIFDPDDKVNILTQLSLLDPSVFATYMTQLSEVNPAAHAIMVEIINKAKTE